MILINSWKYKEVKEEYVCCMSVEYNRNLQEQVLTDYNLKS